MELVTHYLIVADVLGSDGTMSPCKVSLVRCFCVDNPDILATNSHNVDFHGTHTSQQLAY